MSPVRPTTGPARHRTHQVVDPRSASSSRAFVFSAFAGFLTILAALPALAANDEASQLFRAGRIAFEEQNYAVALESFEAAANAGMGGPAVQFNIGVAAYRLGRYERAGAAFADVARTPEMAPLAYYNLGLVALASGDRDAARRWFSRAHRGATDERLRQLASRQLDDLAADVWERNWLGYGALSAGYDDNVALVSNADILGVSDTSDSFAELQLAVSTPLDQPWRLDAGLVMLDYQDLDQFDQLSLSGGARYRVPTGEWTHELGLQLSYTTLDGEGLENRRALLFQTRTALARDWRLRVRYRFSDIEGLEEFEGLSGKRHELGVRANHAHGPWDLVLSYGFDRSDYENASLSAKRHQLGVDVQRELRAAWSMTLELSWRRSDYDLQENGTENRAEAALSAIRSLSSRWRVIVRYAYADNDAQRAAFDYQRSRVSAMLEAIL